MKFDLAAYQTPPDVPAVRSGSADGTWDVAPDAVYQILLDVQLLAEEFATLRESSVVSLSELEGACKAPPATVEFNSFYISVLARDFRIAAGRTGVAMDAVTDAVLALVQGDTEMSEEARRAVATAAQERADDAPGAAGREKNTGHGPLQARE